MQSAAYRTNKRYLLRLYSIPDVHRNPPATVTRSDLIALRYLADLSWPSLVRLRSSALDGEAPRAGSLAQSARQWKQPPDRELISAAKQTEM